VPVQELVIKLKPLLEPRLEYLTLLPTPHHFKEEKLFTEAIHH